MFWNGTRFYSCSLVVFRVAIGMFYVIVLCSHHVIRCYLPPSSESNKIHQYLAHDCWPARHKNEKILRKQKLLAQMYGYAVCEQLNLAEECFCQVMDKLADKILRIFCPALFLSRLLSHLNHIKRGIDEMDTSPEFVLSRALSELLYLN